MLVFLRANRKNCHFGSRAAQDGNGEQLLLKESGFRFLDDGEEADLHAGCSL